MNITKAQLGRLQTLYAQLVSREIGMDSSREGRLVWATERVGRKIRSFSDLTVQEATGMIDGLQGFLGTHVPYKGRPDRYQARRAGLDGRADGKEFTAAPQLVRAEDTARIQRLLAELGWSQETFQTFLNSTRSPLAHRADKVIRTTADANKVWWALKNIAKSKGVWRKSA
jgi:hypothetical protein